MAKRVEDINLPKTAVTRIAKEVLPENVSIGKEASIALEKAASVFVLYVTSASSALAKKDKRKRINGNDIIEAMHETNFDMFADDLKENLEDFRKIQEEKKDAVVEKLQTDGESSCVASKDEDKTKIINGNNIIEAMNKTDFHMSTDNLKENPENFKKIQQEDKDPEVKEKFQKDDESRCVTSRDEDIRKIINGNDIIEAMNKPDFHMFADNLKEKAEGFRNIQQEEQEAAAKEKLQKDGESSCVANKDEDIQIIKGNDIIGEMHKTEFHMSSDDLKENPEDFEML